MVFIRAMGKKEEKAEGGINEYYRNLCYDYSDFGGHTYNKYSKICLFFRIYEKKKKAEGE